MEGDDRGEWEPRFSFKVYLTPCDLTILPWKDTHSRIYGQHNSTEGCNFFFFFFSKRTQSLLNRKGRVDLADVGKEGKYNQKHIKFFKELINEIRFKVIFF